MLDNQEIIGPCQLSHEVSQNSAESEECLNTRSPLPTLLCAEYSVKLKKKRILSIKYRKYIYKTMKDRVESH